MTTQSTATDPALITLDGQEVYSLLDLGPVPDPKDSGVRLDIKLSRIVQGVRGYSDNSLIRELTAHEGELYAWLAKSSENGKAFIADPLGSFKAATTVSSDLLHRIATTGKGESSDEDLQIAPPSQPGPPSDTWTTPIRRNDKPICVLDAGDAVFVGVAGEVRKLNAANGLQMAHVRLRDLVGKRIGRHAVQLAISAEGDRLFVGSHGFVVCLTTSHLETQWHNKLGSDDVNLLLVGQHLYAGIRGNVFLLNAATGNQEGKNRLKGCGNHDVQLATDGRGRLFAGTHGHLVRLGPNVQLMSSVKLPGGGDPVAVLANESAVYAASNGSVSRISLASPKFIKSVRLGHGKHEVRMQFSGDGNTLLLGTNGYVVACDARDLHRLWETKLKKPGVVSVVAGGDVLYAGNGGRVFRLACGTGSVSSRRKAVGERSKEIGMALSKQGTRLVVAYGGFVEQVPISGDRAAGWQAIIATRRRCVNETLRTMFESHVIPSTISSHIAQLTLTAPPRITGGDTHRLTLTIELQGEVSLYAGAPDAHSLAIRIESGYVELEVDLAKLHASIREESRDDFRFSFDLESDPLFTEIDLENLVIKPAVQKLLAPKLLTAMNQAVHQIGSIEFRIEKPLPSSLSGLVLNVSYTKVPGTTPEGEDDFLSVLCGRVNQSGSYALQPAVISGPEDPDTSFTFSNRFVMETVMAELNDLKMGSELGFELKRDQYPSVLTNARAVKINDVPQVWLRVDEECVRSVVHKGALDFNVSISYMNWLTFRLWHTVHGRSVVTFSSVDGDIRIKVTGELDVPWTMYLNPFGMLTPAFKFMLKALFALILRRGRATIAIPGLHVTGVSLPAYAYISGQLKRE